MLAVAARVAAAKEQVMGRKEDIKAFKDAKAKLDAYSAGLPKNSPETDKYLELNRKTSEALAKLPWWRR